MRIGIDVRPALRATTGVGRYLLGLVPALAALGEEVTAFSSSLADRLDPARFPGAAAVDRRIPVRALNLLWGRCGTPCFERLAGPADVVHSPTPLPIPTRRAARTVTVHDLYFLRHPEHASGETRRDWVPQVREAARAAGAVVCVSAHAAREATALLDLEPARLHVAPHGIEPAWFEPPEAGDRAARLAALGVAPPFLLAVGRLEPRKNLPRLVSAFDRLRRAGHAGLALVLAGPDGPAAGEIEAVAARLGVAERIVRTGWLADPDLRALYASAELLAMPSLDEGFGFPVLEAMAAGCPVVCAAAGALPEVGGDAALYAHPGDDEELFEALHRLLGDLALRSSLAARGRERALRFTWAESASRHLAAFRAARERAA